VRTAVHLDLARRLSAAPGFGALAAEQYLAAVEAVVDPAEQQRAAGLLRTAAEGARLTNPALAERLLAAAMPLRTTAEEHAAIQDEWHAILCNLARFQEADEVYAEIERRTDGAGVGPDRGDTAALARSGPACAHIRTLCLRNRQPEALALGLDLLDRLGLAVPPPERLADEIALGYAALRRWVAADEASIDLVRPAADDPVVLARAAVINEILPVAYFAGEPVFAWLVCEAQRMWAVHGPCSALVAPLAHAGFMTIALERDHRTGYEAVRRVLAVSEARGYEPQTAHARFLFSLGCGHWFEPVAHNIDQARRAREGLQYHGDPAVRFTYFSSVPQLLDVAPSLEAFTAEVEAALATAARLGDEHSAAAYLGYRQLARALRGETAAPGSLTDESVDVSAHLASLHDNPTAAANVHTVCAVAGAVFADTDALIDHAAAAMPLLPFINATYLTVTLHLVRALALADQAQAVPAGDRPGVLAELDAVEDWIARRAQDAPGIYGYLVELVHAERHRIEGRPWEAALAFDAAVGAVADPERPLHRALITERAARFHLAAGARHVGRTLLAQALHQWSDWGASGKAAALAREHPGLEPPAGARALPHRGSRSVSVAGGTVDLLGVLQASRALSSVTSLDGLRDQVAEVLGAMTGATVIRLLQWDDAAGEEGPGDATLPTSVVRYVRRTRQPLLVDDATRDARFAKDPYLAELDRCSLLAVPILSRGQPQALLVLEKPASRGAFSAAWLESVTLVAGQLAVALENAAVYASLERKVAQRTSELAAANEQLEELSRTDPLTGLANRRWLEDILEREWRQAAAADRAISIIMVDIDHFKAYNDRLGHQAGDECLRRVATTLAHHARPGDVVARYGGEEFSIILPDCDLPGAHRIAEGLRVAVAGLRAPHPAAPEGHVTISVGVASSVPSPDATAEQLLGRADHGLYEAKQAGRNRVADG
jgi:diguanylate cyclase (GGDEF)-like protein